jgi:hypothetical protein
MKNFYLIAGLWAALISANAQQVATFDDLYLEPGSWYNGSDGAGGFTSGGFWFPNDYNFDWGSWRGFSVSNMKDTTTAGYQNQYSAITAGGVAGSGNYAVVYCPSVLKMQFEPAAEVTGFNVTNSTYAYLTMCNGDEFGAKIFGGTEGTDPDYFKLLISGVDTLGNPTDTLEFFLADFRFEDLARDYILKTWQWVNLSSLGTVKELHFTMKSSDMGDWGMNTPAYFCMDDFTSARLTLRNDLITAEKKLRVFPNPVSGIFHVVVPENAEWLKLTDSFGQMIFHQEIKGRNKISIDALHGLPAGIYNLGVMNGRNISVEKIVKK